MMISEALACFSSIIGHLIKKGNTEEIPTYEKWINLWEKITSISFGILFPIYLPLAVAMYLDDKKGPWEAIAFGASLTVGNWIGLSILAMYQLIKYRKRSLKDNLKYTSISFATFLVLYFLGKFSKWMPI